MIRSRRLLLSTVAAVVVAVAAGSATYLVARQSGAAAGHQPRPSGIPASISTNLANLMYLDPLPRLTAPDFTLTDQAGQTMSLSDLRGKVVVLEFLDPHCTDICPIVSREFLKAYHDLGPLAGKVVFAGINVNAYHHGVSDVLAFSREQQLTTIPDWHYFTGPVPALRKAWRDYNIDVNAPNPNADVQHTSAIYIIDPQGRERFLASPQVDHTKSGSSYLPIGEQDAWGRGIAALARTLA